MMHLHPPLTVMNPKTLTTKPLNIDPRDADDYPLHIKSYTENAFASFYANGFFLYTYETLHIRSKRTYGWLRSIRGRQEVPFLTIYSISGLWRISNEAFLKPANQWMDNFSFEIILRSAR